MHRLTVVRARAQVETPDGVIIYVGVIGTRTAVAVSSILYGNGCSPVTIQRNGLVPVEAAANLTTEYRRRFHSSRASARNERDFCN